MRNWLIGMYLFEYEQKGQDRAEYGENLYKNIAKNLKEKKVKGMSFTMLNTCRQFYLIYQQIIQTVSEQSYLIENHYFEIIQSATEQFKTVNTEIFQSIIGKSNIIIF